MGPTEYSQTPWPSKRRPSWLVVAAAGFAALVFLVAFIWAFSQCVTYKKGAEARIAAAVTEAEKRKAEELEQGFQAERDRLRNKYTTDSVIANVTLRYPRDWSFYLDQDSSARTQIDAIFHPVVVAEGSPGTYGLRLQIVQRLYDKVVADYQNEIERGELKASPIKVSGINGLRLDGQIDRTHSGALVLFPIRDKTLVISTEARDYLSVFNAAIAKLTFTP
jgi:hypothetical protein